MAYRPTQKEVLDALWVLLRELAIGGGRMAQLKRPAITEAFRLLCLKSGGGTWEETRYTDARLEGAGVDRKRYEVIDQEAFERARAYLATTPKERRKRQKRQQRAFETTFDNAGNDQLSDVPIIKMTDNVGNSEFEAEARARRDACCITHSRPQKKPLANNNKRNPPDWEYPW